MSEKNLFTGSSVYFSNLPKLQKNFNKQMSWHFKDFHPPLFKVWEHKKNVKTFLQEISKGSFGRMLSIDNLARSAEIFFEFFSDSDWKKTEDVVKANDRIWPELSL